MKLWVTQSGAVALCSDKAAQPELCFGCMVAATGADA